VGFSILHESELVSCMVGLMMETFQRSSIGVHAVMKTVGESSVNCSKLCSGLFKSQCGVGTMGDKQDLNYAEIFCLSSMGVCSNCAVP